MTYFFSDTRELFVVEFTECRTTIAPEVCIVRHLKMPDVDHRAQRNAGGRTLRRWNSKAREWLNTCSLNLVADYIEK